MPKVEQRFVGRCPRCASRVVMSRVKPDTAGDYEWHGRCDAGHAIRLISPSEQSEPVGIEPFESWVHRPSDTWPETLLPPEGTLIVALTDLPDRSYDEKIRVGRRFGEKIRFGNSTCHNFERVVLAYCPISPASGEST